MQGCGKVGRYVIFTMKVIEISEKQEKAYEDFVRNHPLGSIHQTSAWGEFQSQLPGRNKHWRLAVEDENGKIIATALIIRQALPLKKCWLYCPRGPLADYQHPEALKLLLQKIRDMAKHERAVFFRMDPPLLAEEKIDWKHLGAQKAHAHYQPENTLILDLDRDEEELLKQMKPKGRYNIKVAQKNGVIVRKSSNSPEDIDAFYRLLQQTTSRDEFSGHQKKFYSDMLKTLGEKALLYLAEYQEKIIAGIIVTHHNDTAIYYFGASGNEYRNVMAPYLLQWQAIKDAQKSRMKYYDFLGIAPENCPRHPWAGVTDFKLKFGGRRVDYQPAQEIPYQPFWYLAIKLLKKLRR